jgi:hypothetical protein
MKRCECCYNARIMALFYPSSGNVDISSECVLEYQVSQNGSSDRSWDGQRSPPR